MLPPASFARFWSDQPRLISSAALRSRASLCLRQADLGDGAAIDLLVRHGGTGILSETPEIYGAEHLLTRRAVSREVGEKLIERIKWWEEYTARNKGEMNNNPSPGNKAGGLTTILEKSLGAAAKGGTTPLNDVFKGQLELHDRVRQRRVVVELVARAPLVGEVLRPVARRGVPDRLTLRPRRK